VSETPAGYRYVAPRRDDGRLIDIDQFFELWWEQRRNTYEIAGIMGIPEYRIANKLAEIMDQVYLDTEWEKAGA
jgi:hypothetical protein